MKLIGKIIVSGLVVLAVGAVTVVYADATDDPPPYTATVTAGDEGGGLVEGTQVDLTLPDQFGVSHTVGPDVAILLLAPSKRAGKRVRAYLDAQNADFLSEHRAVFVADISGVPAVFRETVALPMLRKSAYPVLLIYDADLAAKLRSDGHDSEITVARLKNNVVRNVHFAANRQALARLLE